MLRNNDLRLPEQARALRIRTWALEVALDELVELPFDESLVADGYEPCRELADRLRADGVPGAIVPSAALPGTRNVVLFGPRVAAPYNVPAFSSVDVPASITGEHGEALVALQRIVRYRGDPHPGRRFVFAEPSWELEAA